MHERFRHERWRALGPHLDQALELTGEQRAAWLDALSIEDAGLAADIAALLAAHDLLNDRHFLDEAPASPARQTSLEGQVLGAYTLRSRIGQGGMGTVWLAERSDGRFEGRAAVKLLNASLIGHSGEERFRREGGILARLAHPGIGRLLDAGVSSAGQPYLLLEYVDGEPIDRHCDAHALSIEARVRLFLEVLAAVAHAHANLIVHRDIKPSNVLVGPDGHVKLLDFGIAKLIEDEAGGAATTTLTSEEGRVLTPEYAAPEQVTGGTVTTATDVYGLGGLLYLLLAGRHPTARLARSPADLLKAIVETEPSPPSEAVVAGPAETVKELAARRAVTAEVLPRLLKGDLDTIVSKALKKSPGERYASVTALADDLRRYLDHEPISARPDTLGYRARKFVERNRRSVAVAALSTVGLAGLLGFDNARLTAERDRARREAAKSAKVTDLLGGLLAGPDPYRAYESKERTVSGILDAAAERVPRELADQPELEVEMLDVIGKVYENMGLRDKAQPLLEEALAVGRRALGPDHERVAHSLNELGVVLREKGDLAAARPLLEESLRIRRRVLGREHKDVAVTLVELARVYEDQGLGDQAEALFRESLAIRRKVLGEQDHETGTSLNDLALLLQAKGDLSQADELMQHALAIFRKTRGDFHPDVATALNNLGLIDQERHDYVSAERHARESVAIDRRALGPTHPGRVSALNNLGHALREQGRYEEAVPVIEEALRIGAQGLGEDAPVVAMCRVNLARVRLAQGQAAEAEGLLRQALTTFRRSYPERHWRIGVAESLLGAALTALGRYADAEPVLLEADGILRSATGRSAVEAQATRTRLAALYQAWHRPDKAAVYGASPDPQAASATAGR